MARWLGVAAGLCAIASALAHVAYVLTFQDSAITAWNLLIIPAVIVLGVYVAPRQPMLAMAATACGIAASLLWAPAYRAASAEVWWIGLAAAWWLGLSWLLLPRHRATGWLTLILAAATLVDLAVTAADAGQPLLALGGLKIPLTAVWSVWIGVLLIREPEFGRMSLRPVSIQSAAALVGGVVWVIGGAGWLLTHGTQIDVNEARLLGLRGTEYTQLLVVAGLLWTLSLLGARPRSGASTPWVLSWVVAILGVMTVTCGTFLETSVEDPARNFFGLAVQGGWLFFVGGLAVTAIGMVGLGMTTIDKRLRWPYLLIGALAPLPVAAFVFGGINDEGFAAVLLLAFLHAAPGFGFAALGLVLRAGASANQPGRQT